MCQLGQTVLKNLYSLHLTRPTWLLVSILQRICLLQLTQLIGVLLMLLILLVLLLMLLVARANLSSLLTDMRNMLEYIGAAFVTLIGRHATGHLLHLLLIIVVIAIVRTDWW